MDTDHAFGIRLASEPTRDAVAFAHAGGPRFVRELMEFVRFDSVSSDPARRGQVARCAAWLADHLRSIGLERVRTVSTPGHPIVIAEWLQAPRYPTLLIYGHYDVQPPGPLSAWSSPPFEARILGPRLHGRGASDDKGQMWAHVKALESLLSATGRLPLRIKCVFDGEEEMGSPNLLRYLNAHEPEFVADAALLSDMPMRGLNRPALTQSMRGVLSVEVEVSGASTDLHSGLFGGVIDNPLYVLCRLLANLHAGDGRVALPGFYDRVQVLSPQERAYMARVGPSAGEVLRSAGVRHGAGEPGFSPYERGTVRPALTVTSISGAKAGAGSKAVIPASARATLDCRLVPAQDPQEIARLLAHHITAVAPHTVRVQTRTRMTADPVTVPNSGPVIDVAVEALRTAFGTAPVFIRSGGTIPLVQLLQRWRVPTVLMGLALPNDRMHGFDERLYLPNLHRGITASIHFIDGLARRCASTQEPAP